MSQLLLWVIPAGLLSLVLFVILFLCIVWILEHLG